VGGARIAPRPGAGRLRDDEAVVPMPLELTIRGRAPEGKAAPKNAIEWVDTPAALRSVCEALGQEELVGLDVETGLDFGTLCLIQIATAARTYLIDPFAAGDL